MNVLPLRVTTVAAGRSSDVPLPGRAPVRRSGFEGSWLVSRQPPAHLTTDDATTCVAETGAPSLAWLITMPVSAALGVVALELWRRVT